MFTTEKAPGEIHEQPFRENGEGLDDASKLLLKAAALIEERGHCKMIREDGSGRMCAMGAIGMARWGDTTTANDDVVLKAAERLDISIGGWPSRGGFVALRELGETE
jgi:hypothetical protein